MSYPYVPYFFIFLKPHPLLFAISFTTENEVTVKMFYAVFSRSVVSNSATPWTVACQAPLYIGFSNALLQGIFPTPGSKTGLLHCRWILHHLSYQGSPSCKIIALIY